MFGGVGSGKALRYQCRGHRQNSRSADSAARFVSRRPRRSLGLVICAAAGTCLSWPLVRPNRVAMTGVDIVSAASTATPTTASSTTVATSRDESVVAAAVYRPGRDRGHGGCPPPGGVSPCADRPPTARSPPSNRSMAQAERRSGFATATGLGRRRPRLVTHETTSGCGGRAFQRQSAA